MRNMFTRCAAAAAAAVLTLSFSSCGGKDSSSKSSIDGEEIVSDIGDDVNIKAEDMPYGAFIYRIEQGENGMPATIEVDSRFYSEEEAKLICNYFWAICTQDGALFDSVSYKPYSDELLKSGGYSSSQQYMEEYYGEYYTVIGMDFEFSYVYAVDCKTEDSGYNFAKYDDIIKEVAPDAKITSKKVVPVYLNYAATDGSGKEGEVIPRDTYDFPMGAELGDSNYIWICLYEIDGKSYVIS